MQKFNFTFIIPHKNIPRLLQRCLDSIPPRDDIQIIIIDDKSDPAIVDFEKFPGFNKINTEIYLTKVGKGAGYARNFGLKYAKGDWVFFADADDFFLEPLNEFLSFLLNSTRDVIYFYPISRFQNSMEFAHRHDGFVNLINIDIKNGNLDCLRFVMNSPCMRCVRLSFLQKFNINFEEVLAGNDILYSTKVGFYGTNSEIYKEYIYCVIDRNDSLIMQDNKSVKYILSRIKEFYKKNNFLKSKGIYNYYNYPFDKIQQLNNNHRILYFYYKTKFEAFLTKQNFILYIIKLLIYRIFK